MYIPYICIECNVEMCAKYLGLDDSSNAIWEDRKCPICDGIEGEYDILYTKWKRLDHKNLVLLRFLKGKSPQK